MNFTAEVAEDAEDHFNEKDDDGPELTTGPKDKIRVIGFFRFNHLNCIRFSV
jgi:hypothetical protein